MPINDKIHSNTPNRSINFHHNLSCNSHHNIHFYVIKVSLSVPVLFIVLLITLIKDPFLLCKHEIRGFWLIAFIWRHFRWSNHLSKLRFLYKKVRNVVLHISFFTFLGSESLFTSFLKYENASCKTYLKIELSWQRRTLYIDFSYTFVF